MNVYAVSKLTEAVTIDAQWGKIAWLGIAALHIDQHAGKQPDHFPDAQAKLAYDATALYAIFRVEDRFVRAVSKSYQDDVYRDSCVELFFTPGEDPDLGYFNLEVNPGGTALFHHQQGRQIADVPVSRLDFERVQMAHTLPKIVDPEIEDPVTWVVEYRLPFTVLSAYTRIQSPIKGGSWRANLYKCADGSSHPHWLSWSPVDTPAPDFHRPEYFGRLIFE